MVMKQDNLTMNLNDVEQNHIMQHDGNH